MTWPKLWIPIDRANEGTAFLEELRKELSPGHSLFGVPCHAIGRRFDNTSVLFALDDGTERVAEVVLRWKGRPMELPAPGASRFENFAEWTRKVEYADWLARLQPDPAVVPKYAVGDRVLMLRHYDWKADCPVTIDRPGRPRTIFDGSTRIEYSTKFDVPQTDLTDEAAGRYVEYEGTIVLEDDLRPLGDGTRI